MAKPKKIVAEKVTEIQRWLPVTLTEEDVLDRARTLSQRCKDKDQVEIERSAAAKAFGERLKTICGEIVRLSDSVATGIEHRSVKCEERYSYSGNCYSVTRLDTEEVLEARTLRDGERQMTLSLAEQQAEDRSVEVTYTKGIRDFEPGDGPI